MTIQIAIPTNRNQIDWRLGGWLYKIKEEPKGIKPELTIKDRQPVDANRNYIVNDFLKNTKHEWLFFIDDDMIPHPKTDLYKMIGHDKKVVSGLTMVMHNGVPGPLIMKKAPNHTPAQPLFRLAGIDDLKLEEGGSLVKVDGVGTGCLLIHRSVLEEMEPPYFKFVTDEDGQMILSEDYYFSEKVRAMGIQMFVDCEAAFGHGKYLDLWSIGKLLNRVVTSNKIRVEEFGKELKGKEFVKPVKAEAKTGVS